MTPEVLGALGAAVVAILTPIFALMRFIIKELRPNSGSSIKDQLNRLDSRIDEIYSILLNKKEN